MKLNTIYLDRNWCLCFHILLKYIILINSQYMNLITFFNNKSLWCWGYNNLIVPGQYCGCWFPGSLLPQVISSYGIDYVGYRGPCFPWGRFLMVSTICLEKWDKMKMILFFPKANSGGKELDLVAELTNQVSFACVFVDLGIFVNSLWPSDTIWWHRSGSTLAQVMAGCLTAPSHYLN